MFCLHLTFTTVIIIIIIVIIIIIIITFDLTWFNP